MEGKENVSLQNPEGPTVQCLLYRLFFIRIPYFYKIYNIFLAKRFYKQDMGRLSFRLIGKTDAGTRGLLPHFNPHAQLGLARNLSRVRGLIPISTHWPQGARQRKMNC